MSRIFYISPKMEARDESDVTTPWGGRTLFANHSQSQYNLDTMLTQSWHTIASESHCQWCGSYATVWQICHAR